MRIWNIQTVKVEPGVQEDHNTLEKALNDGWEPFSASASVAGHIIYFRKRVEHFNKCQCSGGCTLCV